LKRYILLVIIILVMILGAVAAVVISHDEEQPTTTAVSTTKVKLNEVTRSVFYAPQYAAIANGYFEEAGIEIDLATGQGADQVMTAVLSGQSDIGFAGPEASIYVYNEGKEDYTEVFAQLTKRDGSFLVSREKNDDFKWSDVKGKTIIPGRKGGVPYMTFEYVLKQNGLNPQTDLVLDDSIKFDLMAGAFSAGNADYVTLFEPTATQVQNAGKGYIVASVGEASGEIPYTAYFAKKSYIAENSDLIQNFVNAIYKGQKWVESHTAAEVAAAIQGFFPDTDLSILTAAMQTYKDIDAWTTTPYLTEEAFDRLQTVMIEAGELTQKAPYDKVVNNNYATKAVETVNWWIWGRRKKESISILFFSVPKFIIIDKNRNLLYNFTIAFYKK